MITNIHFIVNPVAGCGKNSLSEDFLNGYFEAENFQVVVKESAYAKNAIQLAKQSVAEKADIIVACGGDGTINEVASSCVHTEVVLGIIPMGSGNGLASNLKIPRDISKALAIIKAKAFIEIDTGMINNELFFSNTGIGFDAFVISNFEKKPTRKLFGYVRSVITSLRKYKCEEDIEISYLSTTRTVCPFLLFVSNSNEMGYKMSLTPKASLQDGLLDVLIVPKLSFFRMMIFAFLFFLKKHHWLKGVEEICTPSIAMKNVKGANFMIQKDGEAVVLKENTIEIKLLHKALKVIIA
ncbi:diacylglycerol/lipid kinase family protein [Ulvibacter litoralis]|uniref:Diacylglycerol kinase family enzyme n=1 Tax=Ulvibacter litoralis TaxID=227084 RepID=A0A1G7GTN0_9FLAO|nr:diacylglycerol kinase family protein [Ulvibacter litoralis]GHC55188.1 hypothetical protein GCM10008083_19100 [Ulvibacter litoralis]SDE91309.1 Diacylglycerol kinase family enzyme [Ulvibacter litoralis]